MTFRRAFKMGDWVRIGDEVGDVSFNEDGVQIMTPAYEGDPERPKLVPRERWYAAPAAPGEHLPLQGHAI